VKSDEGSQRIERRSGHRPFQKPATREASAFGGGAATDRLNKGSQRIWLHEMGSPRLRW
jgi:hypothetical protein